MLIQLVDVVQDKLKGFSPVETKAYYTDITRRAWLAVEGAQNPEIKSAQFDHTLEWTMLDDQFNNRTTDFRQHPRFSYLIGGIYITRVLLPVLLSVVHPACQSSLFSFRRWRIETVHLHAQHPRF